MKQTTIVHTEFAIDCKIGLNSNPKFLSSKYFYDDRGSRIFQQIMKMPEYYLTNCELEIFEEQKEDILLAFKSKNDPFELIELGAGDGMKTKVLLSHFKDCKVQFTYIPVDISAKTVYDLTQSIKLDFPEIKVKSEIGDYFKCLDQIQLKGSKKKIILFLGSNIGNMNKNLTISFLKKLRHFMNPSDLLFIGFDLKKDPELILKAYSDPHGHTSEFNLNLLHRMNKELGANFVINNFKHLETYDPQSGTAKSYLVSLKKQQIKISALDLKISFEKDETISTEISQKYDTNMINQLAAEAGFSILTNFYDKKHFFTNSLWKF